MKCRNFEIALSEFLKSDPGSMLTATDQSRLNLFFVVFVFFVYLEDHVCAIQLCYRKLFFLRYADNQDCKTFLA